MTSISGSRPTSVNSTPTDPIKLDGKAKQKTGIGQKFKAIFSQTNAHFPRASHTHSLVEAPPKTIPKLSVSSPEPTYLQKMSADDMTQNERETLALDAEIAAYPYHQNIEKLADKDTKTESWDLARPLALDAGKSVGLSTKGSKGFIYDQKSGLTAYILQNPKSKEVRLVFGGTSSGKHAGGLVRRNLLNGGFALKQWIGNAQNAISNKVPTSYTQAKELASAVKSQMESDPSYEGFTLKLSGHSKGGGEASYAALSQEEPIQAICFSSAQLGSKMREGISEANKEKAGECISHYAIKGDLVPNMDVLRKHLGHLGKITTIPAQSAMSSPLDRHDKFHKHIANFADLK